MVVENPSSHHIEAFIYGKSIDKEKVTDSIINHIIEIDYDFIATIDIAHDVISVYTCDKNAKFTPNEKDLYSVASTNVFNRMLPPESAPLAIQASRVSTIVDHLKDSRVYTITFATKPDDKGKVHYKNWKYLYIDDTKNTIMYARSDVTNIYGKELEQKRLLNQALKDANGAKDSLQAFITSTPLGVMSAHLASNNNIHDSNIIQFNSNFALMLGYEFEEFGEKIAEDPFFCVLEEEKSKYIESLQALVFTQEKGELPYHARFVKKDESIIWVQVNFNTICLPNGERNAYCSYTNVTREHQLNESLKSALIAAQQASVAKTDFLSRMSHEIRTPMNAIIGMTTLAAKCVDNPTQVSDCIAKIGISSRFLLSLINDILDMSRIESGKVLIKNEPIPFNDLINAAVDIVYNQAKDKGIDFESIVEPSVQDEYIGDAMKLQQVLLNILGNAVKFTEPGGKVTLRINQKHSTKTNATLEFIVNDTGCGISSEFLPHIFDAFEQEHSDRTTVYGGTGLGLAICNNLVHMMNGNIIVRSIVGVGSEFTVTVKLGVSKKTSLRLQHKPQYNLQDISALVVDDDVNVCQSASDTLKEMGVKAEWVDSGRKAIKLVEEKWKTTKYYNLILIDWKMPDLNGIETTREIRKIVGPDVTIIIMTAYDWESIEHEARLAGVNMFIDKPLFRSTLISAFNTVFGEKNSEMNTPYKEPVFDFHGKNVLLCEDHPLNIEVAQHLLEDKGFKVDVAENGVKAIEKFTLSPADFYDAILMDIRMPLMDGLQATSSIRHLSRPDSKTVPIIAMTANAFDDDIEASKRAGMNAHLAKPIEPQLLYMTLYKAIFKEEDTSH